MTTKALGPTSVTVPAGNGYVGRGRFDRAGRLTTVDNAKGGTSLSKFLWTLDAAGNPTKVQTTRGGADTYDVYEYDAKNRLTGSCFAVRRAPPAVRGRRTPSPTLRQGLESNAGGAERRAWSGGWLRTGDLGWLDEEGYLHFAGRLTDSLRLKGENVSAFELEAALLELEEVAECAVLGHRRSDGEDDVVAYVVPAAGAEPSPDRLSDHCCSALGPDAAPTELRSSRSCRIPRAARWRRERSGRSSDGSRRPQPDRPFRKMQRERVVASIDM